jgi:hypothetical protein
VGVDYNCLFNIPVQNIEGQFGMDVIDLSTSAVSFMASGDYEFKYNINNASNQHVACFRFIFTLAKP